ncbi:MAG: hypothetical protein F4062_03525 [Acidimicrobiia bacterium]|nr:hypothetical protein [Acidimicrobiia bacterium]
MPLVLLCVVALAAAGLVLAQLAGRAQLMARAQTAADAAALAGAGDRPATSAERAAVELAAANGAELVGFEADGSVARVEVALAGQSAEAAAERSPPPVAPALAAALDRAGQILGGDVAGSVRLLGPLGSGGIEVPRSLATRLAVQSHRTGLCRAGSGRPVHFVLCPGIHRD